MSPQGPAVIALVALLLVVLSASSGSAQETVLSATYEQKSNTELSLVKVFDGHMLRGYEPYVLTVRNRSDQPMTFRLAFRSGMNGEIQYSSEFEVVADPGGESLHHLLVPVAPNTQHGQYYINSSVTINTPGQDRRSTNLGTSGQSNWPAIAISEALARRNLSELNDAYQSDRSGSSGYGEYLFGFRFDAASLPGDWRGYSGLDALMITTEEWRTAAPAARQAILEWVRLGGRLRLYRPQGESVESLGIEMGDRSLGRVESFVWSGDRLDVAKTYKDLKSVAARALRPMDDYDSGWGIKKLLPDKDFNAGLMVLLLIAFGVIVGPVNLFMLAKPGKRHRLFVTTPLISIAASVLIAVLILFSDGLGGSGHRLLFVDLEPAVVDKKAYLIQEQISRTGVLISSAFDIEDPATLSPVRLAESRWTQQEGVSLSQSGARYSGDWFQSRAEQGQLVEAVRPTRSRIDLRSAGSGDSPPSLFSSVDFELTDFHYIDDDGTIWKATTDAVSAGQVIPLARMERNDFTTWWKASTLDFSDDLRVDLRKLASRRGVFFALSRDSRAGFVDTLKRIRWKDDRAVVFGSVLPAAEAPAP